MLITRDIIGEHLLVENVNKDTWHHRAFVRLICYFHDWLDEQGVGTGDRVILNANNCVEVYALFFALMERGAVFFGTHMPNFHEIERYRMAGAKLVVVDRPEITEAVLATGCFGGVAVLPAVPLIEAQKYPWRDYTPPDPDAPAILAATSGSTGQPVLITHTHTSFMVPVMTAAERFYDHRTSALFQLNLNHLGFVSVFILPCFVAGAHLRLISGGGGGSEVIDALADGIVNHILFFPWLLAAMDLTKRNFVLRDMTIVTGGQVIPPSFVKACFDKGTAAMHIAYGMTEAPPPIMLKSIYSGEQSSYSPSWLGEPIPGYQFRQDPTTGCLVIDGEGVAGGHFQTKDRVEYQDGEWHFVTRFMTIKRGDETIFEEDIAAALNKIIPLDRYRSDHMTVQMTTHQFPVLEDDLLVLACTHKMLAGTGLSLDAINAALSETFNGKQIFDAVAVYDELPHNGLKVAVDKIRRDVAENGFRGFTQTEDR